MSAEVVQVTERGSVGETLQATEERFRLLVESVRDYAIFMLDPEGRITSWNVGAERIKGYRAEEILGHHFSRFYPSDDVRRGKPARELTIAAAEGRLEDEGWRVRKDGSRFWANVVITALRDAQERLVGFAKVTRDLTERKRLEDERAILLAREQAARIETAAARRASFLAEASRRLATSLDYPVTLSAVAHLVVADLADWCTIDVIEEEGRISRVAVAAADPRKEALLVELRRRRPPDRDSPGLAVHVLRTGESILLSEIPGAEFAETACDAGRPVLVPELPARSAIAAPLVARARVLGAITFGLAESARRFGPADLALAENLAHRAALAIDNAHLFREAQAAVRARDAFLARAAHELRTPLTSVLGTVRWLERSLDGRLSESPHVLLDIAKRNLAAMVALVNDLLDVSKLSSGREPQRLEPVRLHEVVEQSLAVVGVLARENGVALRASVEAGLKVAGDRLELEQVLVNLLTNAVKFTPAGGTVTIEAETEERDVVLRVRDSGEGIRPEHLEAIFEPFFQARGRRTRQNRGTGLGLSICRRIVALHGGHIWAESQGPGTGSTFTVRLSVPPAGGRLA